MNRIYLFGIALVITFAISVSLLTNNIGSEIEKVEAMVGTKVVLEKDTAIIIDYSILEESYTLSNGKEISFVLAQKLQVIK